RSTGETLLNAIARLQAICSERSAASVLEPSTRRNRGVFPHVRRGLPRSDPPMTVYNRSNKLPLTGYRHSECRSCFDHWLYSSSTPYWALGVRCHGHGLAPVG